MEAMRHRIQLVPQKLRAAREKAGQRNKTAVAAAAGLSWPGYNKLETGGPKTRFDYNAFVRICDYLGVKPEDISEPIPEPAPQPQDEENA